MNVWQSYRGLRILLFAMSAVTALAGLVLVFFPRFLLSMSPSSLAFAASGLSVALVTALGIIAIAFGYLLCAAAREPVRYVAVIDTVIFTCVCAAALNIYGVVGLRLGAFYPATYLIVRALIQLAIAVALFVLRPRERTYP